MYLVSEKDYIAHHGIKGQRWGIRRFQNEDGLLTSEGKKRYTNNSSERTLNKSFNESHVISSTSKNGQKVVLEQTKESRFVQIAQKYIKSIRDTAMNTKTYTIKTGDKNIGDITLFQESPDSVNVAWLGINNDFRGHGYAQSALEMAIAYCKSRGYKQMTLEVPGSSPDAMHIYEKNGFVVSGIISDDDVWGGLTKMTLRF